MKIQTLSLTIVGLIGLLFSCADYDLMEKSLHPTPVALSIIGVSDTSVTLQWTRYTEEDFNGYRVYCSRNDGIDTTDSLCDTLRFAVDTTKTIRGLSVGTLYYFRVMVVTNGGIGVSNIAETTTVASMKGKLKLFHPDSAEVTDSTIVLRWSNCVSEFDAFKIFMDTNSNVDEKDTLVRTVYDDTISMVRGLDQDRDYWFRAYAVIDTTMVAKSNAMQCRTSARGLEAPIILSASEVTDTTVTLRWNRYNGSDFISYRIYFSLKPSAEPGDSLRDTLAIRTDTIALVRNLLPGTAYAFRVTAMRLRGEPIFSNNTLVTTTKVQKTQIRLFGPEQVTDSSVVLRWSKCITDFDSYRIFKGSSRLIDTLEAIAEAQTNDTVAVVRNLSGSTVYWFRVFARRAGEYVSSSNPIEVLTGKRE